MLSKFLQQTCLWRSLKILRASDLPARRKVLKYIIMLLSLLLTTAALSSPVLSAVLQCHSSQTCPDTPVSCECREALFRLIWSITSINTPMLYGTTYRVGDDTGNVRAENGYTSVLCDVTTSRDGLARLTSKLNFTLTSNMQVECADNVGSDFIPLQTASKTMDA